MAYNWFLAMAMIEAFTPGHTCAAWLMNKMLMI
jgi:hypothetical protein